jgi:hypothetical protein
MPAPSASARPRCTWTASTSDAHRSRDRHLGAPAESQAWRSRPGAAAIPAGDERLRRHCRSGPSGRPIVSAAEERTARGTFGMADSPLKRLRGHATFRARCAAMAQPSWNHMKRASVVWPVIGLSAVAWYATSGMAQESSDPRRAALADCCNAVKRLLSLAVPHQPTSPIQRLSTCSRSRASCWPSVERTGGLLCLTIMAVLDPNRTASTPKEQRASCAFTCGRVELLHRELTPKNAEPRSHPTFCPASCDCRRPRSPGCSPPNKAHQRRAASP